MTVRKIIDRILECESDYECIEHGSFLATFFMLLEIVMNLSKQLIDLLPDPVLNTSLRWIASCALTVGVIMKNFRHYVAMIYWKYSGTHSRVTIMAIQKRRLSPISVIFDH